MSHSDSDSNEGPEPVDWYKRRKDLEARLDRLYADKMHAELKLTNAELLLERVEEAIERAQAQLEEAEANDEEYDPDSPSTRELHAAERRAMGTTE